MKPFWGEDIIQQQAAFNKDKTTCCRLCTTEFKARDKEGGREAEVPECLLYNSRGVEGGTKLLVSKLYCQLRFAAL